VPGQRLTRRGSGAARQACVSIDDLSPDTCVSTDPSAEVVANIAQVDLWKAIDHELRNDTERLVVRLSFAAGLSPREIRALHPDQFPDIAEVYRLKRNLIETLAPQSGHQRPAD